MKKKNLGLKVAALLLAFGGVGAINFALNSAYAMESSSNTSNNKQNVPANSFVPRTDEFGNVLRFSDELELIPNQQDPKDPQKPRRIIYSDELNAEEVEAFNKNFDRLLKNFRSSDCVTFDTRTMQEPAFERGDSEKDYVEKKLSDAKKMPLVEENWGYASKTDNKIVEKFASVNGIKLETPSDKLNYYGYFAKLYNDQIKNDITHFENWLRDLENTKQKKEEITRKNKRIKSQLKEKYKEKYNIIENKRPSEALKLNTIDINNADNRSTKLTKEPVDTVANRALKEYEKKRKQLEEEEERENKKIEALPATNQDLYYETKEEIDKTKKQLAKAQKEWENDDDYDPFGDNEEIKELKEKLDDLENRIKDLLGEDARDE